MYLGYQQGKIKFYVAQSFEEPTIEKWEETEDEYALSADGTEYVLKDEAWEEEQTAKRQADFENNFLATSLGNYRLKPKGYANAQQSIDTINNIVTAMGGLNETIAQMVIFYETPDFSDPEQCTEEWLVEHQTHPEPMTLQEWVQFYIEFTTLYAQKIYKGEQNDNT